MKLSKLDKVILLFAAISGAIAVISVLFPVECGDAYTARFGWDNLFGLTDTERGEPMITVCTEHPLPSLYSATYSFIVLVSAFVLRKLVNYLTRKNERT